MGIFFALEINIFPMPILWHTCKGFQIFTKGDGQERGSGAVRPEETPMPKLNDILSLLPQNTNVNMTTAGHALWMSWQKALPSAVNQTLMNYGGMLLKQVNDQALWFFFTSDVFLAMARLSIWGNFNPLPMSVEIFPARLLLGAKREASLGVEGLLAAQEVHPRDSLDILVHPASRENASFFPGITFENATIRQGMAQIEWQAPVVDSRLPYSSTQGWFVVLHPLGSHVDKNFQEGWSSMYQRLESIFQELKIKFLVQEGFVMASLDSLLMLRTFLRKYLSVFDKDKKEAPGYWPSVFVVADRKNLNFNTDLPKKIGLKWDSLMPDFPYISYRNAYLLGDGFVVRDLRFSGGQTGMDSWCNVMLDENSISSRSIPLVMSAKLAGSNENAECFYCGIGSHSPSECPTRAYFPSRPETWLEIGLMDLDAINEAFREIENMLAKKGMRGYEAILEKGGGAATLLQAIFDLNAASQLRNVPRHWLFKFREPGEDDEAPVKDDSPCWDLLDKLERVAPSDLAALDKEIQEAIARLPRDPRLRMIRGFLQIERGDANMAAQMFKDAATITPHAGLQSWNEYLQGRVMESQGHYDQASRFYAQVMRSMPHWKEAAYRGIVCRVKMGFAEQVLPQIISLIKSEPEYFNHFLIDPALERGRLLILSALYDLWADARKNSANEKNAVAALSARLHDWYPDDHPVQARLGKDINKLASYGQVDNYMAFFQMVKTRPQLEKELNESIQREVDELRNRYKAYLDVLEEIRDEASWFPFPSALKDFSADFNACAGIINWAFAANFSEAQAFKKAQKQMPDLDRLLSNLKKKLRFLRTVRDCTLFGMTMFRTFIWIEIIGLLFCFLGIPGLVLFGDKIGLGWLKYLLGENQWSIQKVLVVIVTILAVGIGALRTTIVFERKREKLLEQAREQREKAQATRVEAIRKKRQAEASKIRKQRLEEEKKAAERQLKARMQN